ncbi:MAG: hypothetical protein D6726_10945, partial [Nitrospirae bacterium]
MLIGGLFFYSGFLEAGCLTVTSPNGGENWQIGTRHEIVWSNTCGRNVKIILRKGGRRLGVIAANLSSSQTRYAWTAGNYSGGTAVSGRDYKILIKTMDNTARDLSNASFVLTARSGSPGSTGRGRTPFPGGKTGKIMVSKMGKKLILNKTKTISWHSGKLRNKVNILLVKDGAVFGTIATNISPLRSTYSWRVGVTTDGVAPVGNRYRIRVVEQRTGAWGESNTFSIENEMSKYDLLEIPERLNFSGNESGIRVKVPEVGEVFTAGGTMRLLWEYTSSRRPDRLQIQLYRGCFFEWGNERILLSAVSGDPFTPDSVSVLRIPDGLEEGVYCVAVRDVNEPPMVWGVSRPFRINTHIRDGTTVSPDPELRIITPSDGVHWDAHNEHTITWEFYPGVTAAIPSTWTITLLRGETAEGYEAIHNLTVTPEARRQTGADGRTWWRYSYDYNIPNDVRRSIPSEERYRIRVSALSYQEETNVFFRNNSINLRFSNDNPCYISYGVLYCSVSRFSRPVDFSVEIGGNVRIRHVRRSDHAGRVTLGSISDFVDDFSRFGCYIPVRVVIDPNNRIEETNEGDNIVEDQVVNPHGPVGVSILN